MRKAFSAIVFALLLLLGHLHAQVVDRYPYIQQPTETSVLIAWNTATAGIGTINWGSGPFDLSHQVLETASSQKHALTITGLQPNTRYFYQVSTDAGYSSAVEFFETAKPIEEKAIRFLHYADCGYNNTVQNQLAAQMELEDVDFAVVAGDVDQGVGNAYDNVFFGVYKNMLAKDCHYTAIGNHDIIANGGTDFYDAFYQPTNNAQQSEHYYSFTWGNAKFICLDSNGDYSIGSDQHDFLLEELKCRDQEWLFVFFHHPPWTNAWDPTYYIPFQSYYQYDGNDDMRTALVPYFEQYDVDFVLNGHSHCYQRGELNDVHYVISGGGGTSTLDQHTCNTSPFNLACSPNIQQELYVNEFVRFNLHGDTVTYQAVDVNGTVVDSVTVIKTWTPLSISLTNDGASSGSTADGSVAALVSGPFPPYSYTWSTGDTTASVSGLLPGTYTVTITDGKGCQRVDSTTVTLDQANDAASWGSLGIVPNPANGSCLISFPNPGHQSCALEVWSLDGKRVDHVSGIRGESVQLDASALSQGIYYVRITGRGISRTGRVAIQH
ncbi:MAG: metallophosphoesterase [Bacteroidia bacterium]